MTNKNIGQQLAAMRRFETKNCECGDEFTGLIKTTKCLRCRNRERQRKLRAKKKSS